MVNGRDSVLDRRFRSGLAGNYASAKFMPLEKLITGEK